MLGIMKRMWHERSVGRGAQKVSEAAVSRPVLSRRAVCAFLGVALLFTCTWCSDFAATFSSNADPSALYLIPRMLSVAVLVLCALRPGKIRLLAKRLPACVALGVVVGVSRLFSLTAGLLPASAMVDVVFSAIGDAAGIVLLVLLFARCCTLKPRQTRVLFPAAYLFAACAYFILMALDPVVVAVLMVLFPVAAGVLLAQVSENIAYSGDVSPDDETTTAWTFPFLPVLLLVIYKFIFYFSLSLTDGPSLYGPLGIAVISLVALAATTFFFDKYSASLLYRLALPLMVAGLLLLAWLHTGSMVATLLTNASNIGFELFILITMAEICFKYRIDGVWMFSIIQASAIAASTVGWFIGRAFVEGSPVGSAEANAVVAIVVVALVAASVLFFNDRLVSKTFGTEPVHKGEGEPSGAATMTYYEELVWRCTRVARRYGLTQREQEVVELLAQGMSTARIEEALCVSNSTAKTHLRHIYEKMNVHSRDDVRKIVEQI